MMKHHYSFALCMLSAMLASAAPLTPEQALQRLETENSARKPQKPEDGRRISTPTRGLYILNGQKLLK